MHLRKDEHKLKRWKSSLMGLLVATTLVTTVSAHGHTGDPIPPVPTVSPWAQAEVKKAQELELVPEYGLPEDYRTPITRQDFRMIAMEFVAAQEHYDRNCLENMISFYLGEKDEIGQLKNVFTDGNADDTKAYLLGVVEGRGNGIFDPEGLITRQEAAVMLTRAYGVCGGTLPKEGTEADFTDQEKIADWAKEKAVALSSWNVMKGMDDGSFAPEGQYSVEQCIVTFLRLYENAPVSRKHGNVTPIFTYEQGIGYMKSFLDGEIYKESFRLEGPVATLIRGELSGTMHDYSFLSFVYRDGGMKGVDLGVCNGIDMGYPDLDGRLKLENPHFSEDGKTFYCTVTISDETITYIPIEGHYFHEKGIYHISIDVDTCQYQLQKEALPK